MSGEVVLFEAKDGQLRLDVRVEHETVWFSLSQMAKHSLEPLTGCAAGRLTILMG